MEATAAHMLFPRQSVSPFPSTGSGSNVNCTGNEFLCLISSPFESQFSTRSLYSAIIFSLVLSAIIVIAFCFIRPYNNIVYAPRAKYADSTHAPPPVQKGLFGWVHTVIKTREEELVTKVGLDAAVFLRFTRMMRNMFLVLTIIGCGVLIPLNVIHSPSELSFFNRLTPVYYYNSPACWAYVVISYIFDAVIFYFLWANYRHIVRLRRAFFDSPDYQRSLHARTLLVTDIPETMRTDDGVSKIMEGVRATGDVPRAVIARNVRDLPDLIEEHERDVRKLEGLLAKYLKNPNKLPAKRPTTKVSGQEVDAIEHYTSRIKELEQQIKQVRLSVDQRNAMPYGFASFESIPDAHSVAYVARKGGPQRTHVRLAPRSQNLIWKNLAMMKKQRDWQNFINNLWIILLTVAWIAPNVLIAVFLSNLSHLALVWPAFKTTLYAHPTLWAIVQGVISPAISTAFYFYLPAIMRKLVTRAGDVTRTDREHHVLEKLFAFFMVNNLIVFSLFSAVWGFVASVISASSTGGNTWDAIKEDNPFNSVVTTMITVSPYWCSWLLQRNLGAAIDLGQLVRLTWGSFSRRFLSPTPRELIELTAPEPFEYAAYYNYFLFYAAVALCFGGLQPLTLAITALYFSLDSFAKKYMIMYIFITKYESGGLFWIALFDRVLIAAGLGNVVVACLVAVKGSSWIAMLASMVPLPFLIAGFKYFCWKRFDHQIYYYNTGKALTDEALLGTTGGHKQRKGDRMGVRFGHPALFKPLMTPMVSARSQHLLAQVYTGRTSLDDSSHAAGFSDVYMDTMDARQLGKSQDRKDATAPFEVVRDDQLDFAQWKDDPAFRGVIGGDSLSRPGTPGTTLTGSHSRRATLDYTYFSSPEHSRAQSRDVYSRGRTDSTTSSNLGRDDVGMQYPSGYHPTPGDLRDSSPASSRGRGGAYAHARGRSSDRLVPNAGRMAQTSIPRVPVGGSGTRSTSSSAFGGPSGRIFTPEETPGSSGEDGSYDYFRRGRAM